MQHIAGRCKGKACRTLALSIREFGLIMWAATLDSLHKLRFVPILSHSYQLDVLR